MCSYNSICVRNPTTPPQVAFPANSPLVKHAQTRITGFYCVLTRLLSDSHLKHAATPAPDPDPTPGQTPYPARPDPTPVPQPTSHLYVSFHYTSWCPVKCVLRVCVICLAWLGLPCVALPCLALSFVCLCHVFFLRVVLFAARKKWTPKCLLTFDLFIRFQNLLFTGIPLTFLFAVNEFNMFAECQVCRA